VLQLADCLFCDGYTVAVDTHILSPAARTRRHGTSCGLCCLLLIISLPFIFVGTFDNVQNYFPFIGYSDSKKRGTIPEPFWILMKQEMIK